jgi:nucleotide-binding universal stress UspA family protein
VSPTADSLVVNIIGKKKWKELRGRNEKEVLETIKSRLTKFCEDVQAELPSCPFITDKIQVKIGNPVEEILQEVENNHYDMVIMGAHGHGVIGDAFMGSVSRRVVRRCKTPVLIVRLPEE